MEKWIEKRKRYSENRKIYNTRMEMETILLSDNLEREKMLYNWIKKDEEFENIFKKVIEENKKRKKINKQFDIIKNKTIEKMTGYEFIALKNGNIKLIEYLNIELEYEDTKHWFPIEIKELQKIKNKEIKEQENVFVIQVPKKIPVEKCNREQLIRRIRNLEATLSQMIKEIKGGE